MIDLSFLILLLYCTLRRVAAQRSMRFDALEDALG
jgi:hypothetical protein